MKLIKSYLILKRNKCMIIMDNKEQELLSNNNNNIKIWAMDLVEIHSIKEVNKVILWMLVNFLNKFLDKGLARHNNKQGGKRDHQKVYLICCLDNRDKLKHNSIEMEVKVTEVDLGVVKLYDRRLL